MKPNIDAKVVCVTEHVCSQLDDELVILDTKNGSYFGLNEVGSRIWSLMQTPTSVSSIRDTLLNEYQVEPQQLESDLMGLLTALHDRKLIQIVEESIE